MTMVKSLYDGVPTFCFRLVFLYWSILDVRSPHFTIYPHPFPKYTHDPTIDLEIDIELDVSIIMQVR